MESIEKNTDDKKRALTVSQLTQKIKGLLELEVGHVWLQGEISGYRPAPSGHLYFNIKDEGSIINCALFKGVVNRCLNQKFQIKEGLEVLVYAQISVYAPRGNYQLIVQHIEPMGAGALRLAFEELKKKLSKEGLFEEGRKRKIPSFPNKVALITSPTGAALQDMLNVLGRRNAGISILIVPTLVQGEDAPPQIIKAIETVNRFDLADVIIVARGGGSAEDLWSFNDEGVVRALAASKIPTISAVGHEIDFTLCDFVSDLRAPTPSAAAELVSQNRIEVMEQIKKDYRNMLNQIEKKIHQTRNKILQLEQKLISPHERLIRFQQKLYELKMRLLHTITGKIPEYRQRVDELIKRAEYSASGIWMSRRRQFDSTTARLDALSPLKVLGRGYTLIEDLNSGKLLKSAKLMKPGMEVNLIFKDGKSKAKCI